MSLRSPAWPRRAERPPCGTAAGLPPASSDSDSGCALEEYAEPPAEPAPPEERYCPGLAEEEREQLQAFSARRRREALGQGLACPVPGPCHGCPCKKCGRRLNRGDPGVSASRLGDELWHPSCFCCHFCHQPLVDLIYFQQDGRIYCGRHHAELFRPRCASCDQVGAGGEQPGPRSARLRSAQLGSALPAAPTPGRGGCRCNGAPRLQSNGGEGGGQAGTPGSPTADPRRGQRVAATSTGARRAAGFCLPPPPRSSSSWTSAWRRRAGAGTPSTSAAWSARRRCAGSATSWPAAGPAAAAASSASTPSRARPAVSPSAPTAKRPRTRGCAGMPAPPASAAASAERRSAGGPSPPAAACSTAPKPAAASGTPPPPPPTPLTRPSSQPRPRTRRPSPALPGAPRRPRAAGSGCKGPSQSRIRPLCTLPSGARTTAEQRPRRGAGMLRALARRSPRSPARRVQAAPEHQATRPQGAPTRERRRATGTCASEATCPPPDAARGRGMASCRMAQKRKTPGAQPALRLRTQTQKRRVSSSGSPSPNPG
ncbi:prickle-like protein 4 isoform X2 [Rhea pennata]|uniref:prickle-like protein 4 isoform X2 n=1 Tax=Rhea pennata TaxID=8795 RepID=UPI002E26DF16